MYAPSLLYKRETPVRERLRSKKGDWKAEDRLIHRHRAILLSSGRRVLRSGGPNHSKILVCSCVLAPKLDRPNRLAQSRVHPPRGLGGCVPPPGCGYPKKPTTDMSKPSQPMLGKFLLNWCHPDPIPNNFVSDSIPPCVPAKPPQHPHLCYTQLLGITPFCRPTFSTV